MTEPTVSNEAYLLRFSRMALRHVELRLPGDLPNEQIRIGTRTIEILCLGTAAPLIKHQRAPELGPACTKPTGAFSKKLNQLETLLGRPLKTGFDALLQCFTNADGTVATKQDDVSAALSSAIDVAAALQRAKDSAQTKLDDDSDWWHWFLAFSTLDIPGAIFFFSFRRERPIKFPHSTNWAPPSRQVFAFANDLEEKQLTSTMPTVERRTLLRGRPFMECIDAALNCLRFHEDRDVWLRQRPARAAALLCDPSLKDFVREEALFLELFPDGEISSEVEVLLPIYRDPSETNRTWGIESWVPTSDRPVERMWLRQMFLARQCPEPLPLALAATHYDDWPAARRLMDEAWGASPITTAAQFMYARLAARWVLPTSLQARIDSLSPFESTTAMLSVSDYAPEEIANELLTMKLSVDDVVRLATWWSEHIDEDDEAPTSNAVAKVLEALYSRTKGAQLVEDERGRSEIRFTREIETLPVALTRFIQAYALGVGGAVAGAVEIMLQRTVIPSARAIEVDGSPVEPVARLLSKALGELMTVPVKDDPSDPKKRWPFSMPPWGTDDGRVLLYALGELATSHSITVLERVNKFKKAEAPDLADAAKTANDYLHNRRKRATPRERIDNVSAALHFINRVRRKQTPGAREQAIVEHMTR